MKAVAALFVRKDSIYHSLPGVDAWDIDRDARRWPGGVPGVFHPPCRAWGRLRHFAKPRLDERELAPWAVEQVRRWGGVLEHPAESRLWAACGLPAPGRAPDAFGGWTAQVRQCDWGHRAEKLTWLYIVGCHPDEVPERPVSGKPTAYIKSNRLGYRPSARRLPHVTHAEREHTPPALAEWLVELARRCQVASAVEERRTA